MASDQLPTTPAISTEDEEQPRHQEPRQTLLSFEETTSPETSEFPEYSESSEASEAPAASNFLHALGNLLLADEATRKQVAELLLSYPI